MTFSEFKAWLEGFEESFFGAYPNSAQWDKIKEKLDTVENLSATPSGVPALPIDSPWDYKKYEKGYWLKDDQTVPQPMWRPTGTTICGVAQQLKNLDSRSPEGASTYSPDIM